MPRLFFLAYAVALIMVLLDILYKTNADVCKAGSQVTAREFSPVIDNNTITGPVISTTTAANPRECELKCHFAVPDDCRMFNYYPDTHVCELLYNDRLAEYKVNKKNGASFKARKCQNDQCARLGEHCYSMNSDTFPSLCTNNTGECNNMHKGNNNGGCWFKATPSPVCFGALNDSFGRFYVPRNGQLRTFRMVHVSGSLKQNTHLTANNWGSSAPENKISIIVTNEHNSRICPPASYSVNSYFLYSIEWYDDSSPEIILPDINPPLYVTEGQELRVWYGEDYSTMPDAEGGNEGATCADVYLYYY